MMLAILPNIEIVLSLTAAPLPFVHRATQW
jgi:hypothetical protein